MAIDLLTALFYTAGAAYGANRQSNYTKAKLKEEATEKLDEAAAASQVRYYGMMPDGSRQDGVLNNSAALPGLLSKGYKIEGMTIGNGAYQEFKTPFESEPVYYDSASNSVGTGTRIAGIRNEMPFRTSGVNPRSMTTTTTLSKPLKMPPAAPTAGGPETGFGTSSPPTTVRPAGTEITAPTGFKYATPLMEPNPKFTAITRLPIIGWTKEDGSYAIDENYNELQNIMQESQETEYLYTSPTGDTQRGRGTSAFVRFNKTRIEKGGTIRKGKDLTMMQFPDSEKDDPNRVLNILQPDGSNIPFAQAPNKVKLSAYGGGLLVQYFKDGQPEDKPFKLQEMEKVEAGKIIDHRVMLDNKTIKSVTELTPQEFENFKNGKYPHAKFENGQLVDKYTLPTFTATKQETGEERVLIPDQVSLEQGIPLEPVPVLELTPVQMEKYLDGEYQTAFFKDGVQQGKFLFPSERDKSSGKSGGSGADNPLTDPKQFAVKDYDSGIIFAFPSDDFAASNAARIGMKSILNHPKEFENGLKNPKTQKLFMNHLSNLANEVINHWTAENVTGRRGEAVVIPEDFLNKWALPRYGSFIEAMGTDTPKDVGTIFRNMIQEKIGQKIIDLRTLPARDQNTIVTEDIVEIPNNTGGTTPVRVIAGRQLPINEAGETPFGLVVQALRNRDFKESEIASFILVERDDFGLPVLDADGMEKPLPIEQQTVLAGLDLLFSKQLEFIIKRDMPAQGLKKGESYTGTYYDAMKRMITPDAFAMVEDRTLDTETQQAVANVFLSVTGDDPRIGMDLVKRIYPVSGATVESLLEDRFGAEFNKIVQARAAKAGSAREAMQSARNKLSTYFTINMETGEKVPMDISTTVSRYVLGADGIVYLVNTARDVLTGNFINRLTGETGNGYSEMPQDAASIVAAARNGYVKVGSFVTAPDKLATTERFQDMTEAERNAAIEASRIARARNGRLFQRILKDMTANPSEMVTLPDNRQVSKRLLAVRQYYKFILAYQVAAAIQGGTGGRTISDQDVENILSALNFDTYSTPEAEKATLNEVIRMMERIAVVDGAYSSGNVSDVYAAIAYEKLEDRAGASFRPTVFDVITEAAMRLRQPGARDRSATGITNAKSYVEAEKDTPDGISLLEGFNGFQGTYYTDLDEAKKDDKWSSYVAGLAPRGA